MEKYIASKGILFIKWNVLVFGVFVMGNYIGSFYIQKSETQSANTENLYERVRLKTKAVETTKLRQISTFKDLAVELPEAKFNKADVPNLQRNSPPPQFLRFYKEDVFLSSAFVDFRFNDRQIRTFILHKPGNTLSIYCHVQCSNKSFISVKASHDDVYPEWPQNNLYIATVYSCHLAKEINTVPTHVNFSINKGGKHLKVELIPVAPQFIGSKERENNVAACIKCITGKFPVSNIMEWTEFHRLLGISRFSFYNASLTGEGNDVLKYYKKLNIADIHQFPMMSNVLKYEYEKHPLNKAQLYSVEQQVYLISILDCLYRNINNHKHILLLDLDELLTPVKQESIQTLLKKGYGESRNAGALMFNTGWYFDDFKLNDTNKNSTSLLRMVKRDTRTLIQEQNQPKSVLNSDRFLNANWHGALSVGDSSGLKDSTEINKVVSSEELGYIHHFRGPCIEKFYSKDCVVLLQKSVHDRVLPRYVQRMEQRMQVIKSGIHIQ